MKRKVALALVGVMVLSMVGGCSSGNGDSKGGSGDSGKSGDKVVMKNGGCSEGNRQIQRGQ